MGQLTVRTRNFLILAFCLTSIGCGPQVDVPENLPKLGKWSDSIRIASVRENGVAIGRDDLPSEILPHETEKQFCGEPKFRNIEEVRESLDIELFKYCDFSEPKRFGHRFSVSAQCDLPSSGSGKRKIESRGALKMEAEEQAERVDVNIAIDVYAQSRKGTTEKVTAEFKRELIRLGDC